MAHVCAHANPGLYDGPIELFALDRRAGNVTGRWRVSLCGVVVAGMIASVAPRAAFGQLPEPGARPDVPNPLTDTTVKPGKVSGLGTNRKSTRLNSSHLVISYAVFCLK